TRIGEKKLQPEDTLGMVKQLLTEKQWHRLEKKGELDFSISRTGLGRFRINAYRQRGSYGLAIRALAVRIPSMEELKLPMILKDLAMKQRGLILVTGPTGSGKSTTLASVIDYINMQRSCHILTLEDPIEYLHRHNLSMVNQREMGHDSFDFANALRAALRQDPDVILVGEMRDLETIAIAVTAAETGHLVLSTLHTVGAAKTIDRVIDVFPPHQQQQIRVQLASELEGVISQQLLPTADGVGRVAAFEVMTATPAIRNLIRENKTHQIQSVIQTGTKFGMKTMDSHQIQSVIQTGTKFGMKTMDSSLIELYKNGIVTQEMALDYSVDREYMEKTIGSSFY
ncbi:MAG: type pili twitching motility protein PilT, partial [Clostridia bacterium]|nr:type pili twitching motility protein PilT [Clostridia bacterium]